MNTTLYLDPNAWDLVLDASANIALASEPYSLAQDAASAIRTFLGEVYYDTTQGIDYFGQIFGVANPSLAFIKAQLVAAALTVPNVASAQVFLTSITNRVLTGAVQITSSDGAVAAASFSSVPFGLGEFVLDSSTLG